MRIKHTRGVTLIELLTAMAVIAVLASIAIPMYSNYVTTSRTTEGWNALASIKLAQEEYFLENNRYFPDPDSTVNTTANSISAYWSPSENDADRNFNYSVTSTGTGTAYVVTATGRGAGFDVPTTVSFSLSN